MDALLLILKNTALQFGFLFGAGLIGGATLTLLSRLTNNVFRQFRWPQAGTYLFGWIGVPVHEFCHAFFCRVFLHEIKSIKWFDPSGKGGAQGSVTHTYSEWNPYQRIGHFFIGLGPVLLGPALIAATFLICVPSARGLYPALTEGGVHGAFTLVMAPFLVDVTGNSLDLYDAVVWWDDLNHIANWALLLTGLGLVLGRGVRPAWALVVLVTGLGAILAIAWELGEWWTFIRHGTELATAYEDTLGDEALGTLGALVAGLVVARQVGRGRDGDA